MKRKMLAFVGLFSIVFLLAACGGGDDNQAEETGEAGEIEAPTISEEEKLAEDELVVTVNDDEVTGVTYNLVYTQLKLHAVQTGQDLSDDELKEMTIDSLIDRQLLMQEADKEGLLVSDDEAQEELEQLKEENKEGFETLLEQYQITEKLFQHQLVFELTMNKFLTEKIDVNVTNEEVEEAYEEAKEENEDLPELNEIHDTLKAEIENHRTNEALEEEITNLKDKSEIEIHI